MQNADDNLVAPAADGREDDPGARDRPEVPAVPPPPHTHPAVPPEVPAQQPPAPVVNAVPPPGPAPILRGAGEMPEADRPMVPVVPGIVHPAIPPIADGEREACGFVSNRSWTALPPRAMGAQRKLEVQFQRLPAPFSGQSMVETKGMITLDVTAAVMSPDEVTTALTGAHFNHQQVVSGYRHGTVMTQRAMDLRLQRCPLVIRTPVDEKLAEMRRLVVVPAYAASFAATTDKETLASRKLLPSVFAAATPTMTEVQEVARHCSELLTMEVEDTRFLMRLAVMYVESRLAHPQTGRAAVWDTGMPAPVVYCENWASFRNRVYEDIDSGVQANYVPWGPLTGYKVNHEGVIVRILRFAASDQITLQLGEGMLPPMMWPEIPNAVLYSAYVLPREETHKARYEFYPRDVYLAGEIFCLRYSTPERWTQMVQLAHVLYWQQRGSNVRLASLGEDEELGLPSARMQTYVVGPYLSDNCTRTPYEGRLTEEDVLARVAESVSTALLLGLAGSLVRWQLLEYSMVNQILEDGGEWENRRTLFTCYELGVPIWGMITKTLNDLGYSGHLGTFLPRLAILDSFAAIMTQLTNAPDRIQSGDCIGYLPRLPIGDGAHGWIAPLPLKPPHHEAEQNVAVDLIKTDTEQTVAGLEELAHVEFFFHLEKRDRTGTLGQWTARASRTRSGCAVDYPRMAITNRYGDRYRSQFRMPTDVIYVATDPDHDRYKLEWAISRYVGRVAQIKPLLGCSPDPRLEDIQQYIVHDIGQIRLTEQRRAEQAQLTRLQIARPAPIPGGRDAQNRVQRARRDAERDRAQEINSATHGNLFHR